MNDPFSVLGVPADATLADIRAARRRLAVTVHPDRGGTEEDMKVVNVAFEAAVAHVTGRRRLGSSARQPAPPTQGSRGRSTGAASPGASAWSASSSSSAGSAGSAGRIIRPRGGGRRSIEHDSPSFTIDALPVEAFEALLIVTSWIGEVLVDEPPYLLDVHLYEPDHCWCRLELVPDAGGSTVSLTVASIGGTPAPDIEHVRDVWVAHVNQLGHWTDDPAS